MPLISHNSGLLLNHTGGLASGTDCCCGTSGTGTGTGGGIGVHAGDCAGCDPADLLPDQALVAIANITNSSPLGVCDIFGGPFNCPDCPNLNGSYVLDWSGFLNCDYRGSSPIPICEYEDATPIPGVCAGITIIGSVRYNPIANLTRAAVTIGGAGAGVIMYKDFAGNFHCRGSYSLGPADVNSYGSFRCDMSGVTAILTV